MAVEANKRYTLKGCGFQLEQNCIKLKTMKVPEQRSERRSIENDNAGLVKVILKEPPATPWYSSEAIITYIMTDNSEPISSKL